MPRKQISTYSSKRGFVLTTIAAIVAVAAIAVCIYYIHYKKYAPRITIQPDRVATTTESETYTDPTYNFSFTYPAGVNVDAPSGQNNGLWLAVDNLLIHVHPKPKGFISLAKTAQSIVVDEQAQSKESAAPVTVSSKSQTVGSLAGWFITAQAADVPMNTSEEFLAEHGDYLIEFSYNYEGYALTKDPTSILAGAKPTASFADDTQAQADSYKEIQDIIASFTFSK